MGASTVRGAEADSVRADAGQRSQRLFAPDGKWIAYSSDESGRDAVYVQPFPATGRKWQISRNGGTQPEWRGDGKEIFFLALDGTIIAAAVETARGFESEIPRALFAPGVRVPAGLGITTRVYAPLETVHVFS